jgi:hypothetical protein
MASSDGYSLDEDSLKYLRKMVLEHQRKPKNQHPPRSRRQYGGAGSGTWIGTLQGSLAYGSSATVMLKKWNGSAFVDDVTATVYPWMMNTGDSIAANVQVFGGFVGSVRVVGNAACKNIYGS